MEFKATCDNWAKGSTIFVTVLFTFFIVMGFVNHENGEKTAWIQAIGLSSLYVAVYLFSPKKYTVTLGGLIIHRPAKNIMIGKSQIKSVRILDKKSINNALRTFGVGGMFGYYGFFRNAGFGRMTWYVTRTDKVVLIRTIKGKQIVISPDDCEKFIEAITRIIE